VDEPSGKNLSYTRFKVTQISRLLAEMVNIWTGEFSTGLTAWILGVGEGFVLSTLGRMDGASLMKANVASSWAKRRAWKKKKQATMAAPPDTGKTDGDS